MKIDVIIAVTTLLVTPKSEVAWKVAGATMVEETWETKGKAETTKLAAHLRRNGQLHRDNIGSATLLRIMSHKLTFSGYQDLGDRPNRR